MTSYDGTVRTIQITITGTNDGPVLSGPAPQATVSEDDSTFTFDLLSGVSDGSSTDTLSVDVSLLRLFHQMRLALLSILTALSRLTRTAYTHLPVGGDASLLPLAIWLRMVTAVLLSKLQRSRLRVLMILRL